MGASTAGHQGSSADAVVGWFGTREANWPRTAASGDDEHRLARLSLEAK